MDTLRVILERAEARGVALGHFNVSDLATFNGVVAAARELGVPVMIGASEGERAFIGVQEIAALVRSVRDQGAGVFLNADHTHSLAKAEEAARAGFDEIVFDASDRSFDDNVKQTRQAVTAIKSINPSILVEGEIGYIGSSSSIHERAPEQAYALSTPDEGKQFVEATGIDVLAPSVGNMHGLLREMVEQGATKRLDVERIRAIKQATGMFLTLHGGSGTHAEDLQHAIAAGITIVHINTELRVAWRRGLESALAAQPDEVVPYKLLPAAVDRVKAVARARLQLLNSLHGTTATPSETSVPSHSFDE